MQVGAATAEAAGCRHAEPEISLNVELMSVACKLTGRFSSPSKMVTFTKKRHMSSTSCLTTQTDVDMVKRTMLAVERRQDIIGQFFLYA